MQKVRALLGITGPVLCPTVHHTLQEAFEILRPGLHWDDVHYKCHVTLVKEFIRLGIFVGSENEILDSQISAAFFPHGLGEILPALSNEIILKHVGVLTLFIRSLGHSLGLDVHDVPSASRPEPESENKTIPELSRKHPLFYTYLRLRLPLEAGMVVVSAVADCF